jgi:hypothetical protein
MPADMEGGGGPMVIFDAEKTLIEASFMDLGEK